MSKMTLVNKQFLTDIFGLSYLVQGSCSKDDFKVREVLDKPYTFHSEDCDEDYPEVPNVSLVEQPYGYNHPTPESAYADMLSKIKTFANKKISHFKNENLKFGNKVLLLRHSMGMLPEKRMAVITRKLNEIEDLKALLKVLPSLNEVLISLEDEYYIVDGFIEPNQTCYVFEKAHSIYFESAIHEVTAIKVGVNPFKGETKEDNKIYMTVDLQKVNDGKRFHIGWSDFRDFNGDYFKTGTTGQFVFTDKAKCLAFAKEMLNKDIEKLQNNMNALTV
jgi:hypothetical protein